MLVSMYTIITGVIYAIVSNMHIVVEYIVVEYTWLDWYPLPIGSRSLSLFSSNRLSPLSVLLYSYAYRVLCESRVSNNLSQMCATEVTFNMV